MGDVDELMAALEHPHKDAIERLRVIVRAADPTIREGVKWNAPSFRVEGGEWFATVNLRPPSEVRVVLHTGAKAVPGHPDLVIDDPRGLLKWLGKDRAIVAFGGLGDVEAAEAAFTGIVQQWVSQLP